MGRGACTEEEHVSKSAHRTYGGPAVMPEPGKEKAWGHKSTALEHMGGFSVKDTTAAQGSPEVQN